MPKLDDDTILSLIRFYRSLGFTFPLVIRLLSLFGISSNDLQRVCSKLGGV